MALMLHVEGDFFLEVQSVPSLKWGGEEIRSFEVLELTYSLCWSSFSQTINQSLYVGPQAVNKSP